MPTIDAIDMKKTIGKSTPPVSLTTADKQQRIWQVVSLIPSGKVASYGQVAEMAGLARAARLVGAVLKALPKHSRLPWHRVVQSQGSLAFPVETEQYQQQKIRLESEGIVFNGLRINMKNQRWTLQ